MLTVMTTRFCTMDQVRAFLEGTEQVDFEVPSRAARLACIAETLAQFAYWRLGRRDKGLLVRFLCRITGYSRQQMTRLIARYRRTGRLHDGRCGPARPFATRYTAADVALLAEVDALHGTLSGPATRKLCERAYERDEDARFVRLAGISVSHLYNLRRSRAYVRTRGHVTKTRPVQVKIGERRVPQPEGRPGFLRVDSVHSGDWDGVKGLYMINLVDEVTQYQLLAAVPRLNEGSLVPVLERLLAAFPFRVLGFHTDNGSEYVNHQVAGLLNKLLVEFTKSRPRRSNDNALVESKNGSVVRKHLGHAHIPAGGAAAVNVFLEQHLWGYLNYHRPCFFPTVEIDAKGRQRKRYRYQDLMTPYDKLRSLPDAGQYLKPAVSWESLDAIAGELSDNEAARRMNEARDKLFQALNVKAGVA
jgi:hypothetical protein